MNNVYLIDIALFALFTAAVLTFLYIKRKNLVKDGIMYLYKTQLGLNIIEKLSKSCPKTLRFLSWASVITGYFLMAFSIYFVWQLISIFSKPEFVQQVKIPPIMPLIPYLPELFKIDFLPPFYFSYWFLAIALVAIFHEGFHGIFARFYNVKIKSTGFGFLGPLLAFFVEQDSKQMKKAKIFHQLSILSAGVFANILLAIIFIGLFGIFMASAYSPSGVVFSDYSYAAFPAGIVSSATLGGSLSVDGLNFSKINLENKTFFVNSEFFKINVSSERPVKAYYDLPAINSNLRGAIVSLNGIKLTSMDIFSNELAKYKPGDKVNIETEFSNNSGTFVLSYNITLKSSPENSSRAVLGIASASPVSMGVFKNVLYKIYSVFSNPLLYYKPVINADVAVFIKNLFWWLIIINISVAIMNMLTLGIFDGGMFFMLTVLGITKSKRIAETSFKIATWALIFAVVLVTIFWGFGFFGH